MLNKLPNEVLFEIIHLLSFKDSLNLFRIDIIEKKISSKSCTEILYRKMLMESVMKLEPYDVARYIKNYIPCAVEYEEELINLARINFSKSFLSQFDSDEEICDFIQCVYKNRQYLKYGIDKSLKKVIKYENIRIAKKYLHEISKCMNPREIMYDIGIIRDDNRDEYYFASDYTDKIEDILSLEYPK